MAEFEETFGTKYTPGRTEEENPTNPGAGELCERSSYWYTQQETQNPKIQTPEILENQK